MRWRSRGKTSGSSPPRSLRFNGLTLKPLPFGKGPLKNPRGHHGPGGFLFVGDEEKSCRVARPGKGPLRLAAQGLLAQGGEVKKGPAFFFS